MAERWYGYIIIAAVSAFLLWAFNKFKIILLSDKLYRAA